MSNRKLIVEVIVDPKKAERGFTQTSRSAKVFERDLGHATRGALAGSGVFRGLGRSLAFASGGFLAFASAGDFIRKSIDAAKEAQVTQAQLSQQLKNGGKNFADYRDEIDRTNLALSSLSGFTKDELDASLTTILRTTGSVSKALRDNALAADIARARHISLAAAATIVAKTEAGNTTLLRRQGFQIAKNATVEQALASVRATVAGQARAGTTEQERFGAVLHDSEVIIGNGLLPTVNKYLVSGTKWLQQMNESGKLQKDVARDAQAVSHAITESANAVRVTSRVFGGFSHVIELLIGLKLASQARGWGLGMKATGTEAEIASGKVAGLRGNLLALSAITVAPIVIPIIAKFDDKLRSGKGLKGAFGKFVSDLAVPSQFVGDAIKLLQQDAKDAAAKGIDRGARGPSAAGGAGVEAAAKAIAGLARSAAGGASGGVGAAGKHPANITNEQRNRFFDSALTRSLDRVQDLGLNQQIVRLQQIAGLITKRIAATKDITRKLNLEDQLVGVNRQIKGVRTEIAQNVAARIQSQQAALAEKVAAAREAAAAASAARAARNQSAQFKALGLSATGDQIIPVRNLKAELGRLTDQVSGTLLDTSKTKSLFANIRKIFAGGFGALTAETKSQIKTMLDGIAEQIKNQKGTETAFRHLSSAAFAASISGLSAAQTRQIRAAFTQVGAGGSVPGARSAAFSGAGQVTQIYVDGKKLATAITPHQQRHAQRRSVARSGPWAGRH